MRRTTVKEVRKWMKTLEENRYKKTYLSDCRRVAWMVNNNLSEDYDTMPISMKKKWSKAQYGRERFLAKDFVKHLMSKQVNEDTVRWAIRSIIKEGKLSEGRFKLSGRSEMQWTGSSYNKKIAIMAGNKKVVLDKKEIYNMLKGIKMHRLSEGKLTEARKATIFDVAFKVMKDRQAYPYKSGRGKTLVDMQSANLLVKVFKKINPKMKKILSKLGYDNPAQLMSTLWTVAKAG